MNVNSRVKLYTLSTCAHCKALRDFFEERKVRFDSIDVDLLQGQEKKAMLQEVRLYNARCSFPTSVIGDRVVVGFREEELRDALLCASDLCLDRNKAPAD